MITLVFTSFTDMLFSVGAAMEQPGNLWHANIFQIWIAMAKRSDNKLERNGEIYIVLRFLVPTLQRVKIWCEKTHTFVPL